jgi:Fe-S-cluster containining protein
MNHLEQALARNADPKTFSEAKRRADIAFDRIKASGVNTMMRLLQEDRSLSNRKIWLKEIMKAVDKSVQGLTPCKAGCSHCCYMATNVTLEEAQAISAYSGKPIQALDDDSLTYSDDANIKRFEGVPCPFLVDNQCSVYEVRPFACRVHYSVDSDNLLCKIIPGESIRSPTLNTLPLTALNLLCYPDPLQIQYADIREFFQ